MPQDVRHDGVGVSRKFAFALGAVEGPRGRVRGAEVAWPVEIRVRQVRCYRDLGVEGVAFVVGADRVDPGDALDRLLGVDHTLGACRFAHREPLVGSPQVVAIGVIECGGARRGPRGKGDDWPVAAVVEPARVRTSTPPSSALTVTS